MSTHKPTLSDEIDRCNDQLDCLLQERFGVSFRVYKTLLALVRLATVVVCGYAMTVDSEATTLALLVLAAVVVGPDFVEAIVTDDGGGT